MIPYSAYKIDLERRYLKYRCTFHKNNQGDGCNACLVFRTDLINMQKAYSFVLEKSILTHNHPLTPNFVFSHRNCIPLEIQDKIREQQEIGVLPGRIRSNLNIIVNKNIFYNIRRPIICKDRTESFNELIHKITQSMNQQVIMHENQSNSNLDSLTVVYDEVRNSVYFNDIVIADDTAATNIYNLPMEVLACFDQENHTQILSFGILQDKTINSFENYFNDVKQIIGNTKIRIFVVDRLSAQIAAIKNVFPDAFIVFCLTHIKRDLIKNFGRDSGIVQGFNYMLEDYSLCEEYIWFLTTEMKRLYEGNIKGWKALKDLIEQREHWLPADLIKHGMYAKFSSSRIENFFGLFKSHYGHNQRGIIKIIDDMNNISRLLLVQSTSEQIKTTREYTGFPLILPCEIQYFGKLILDIINEEYDCWLKNITKNENLCVWCNLRKNNSEYALPCRHVMRREFVITCNSVHPTR